MSTDRPATTDQQPKVYGTEATAEPRARRRVPPPPGEVEIVDTDGCHRACRNGHTYRWGGCEYAEEPPQTLARWKTFTASDGHLSIGTETLTAEQVAEWLREQGYTVATRAEPDDDGPDVCECDHVRARHTVTGCLDCDWCPAFSREAPHEPAARASEAPGDAGSPTPDVGAAQGEDDGPQGRSALPSAPCPRWSHEEPHPAHDWDAPVDGASWCPGVADPDAAAESEPRPMRGEDVPAEWIALASRGYSMHGAGLVANLLAAVIPAIRAQAIADAYNEVTKLHDASTYQDGYGWFERAAYANVLDALTRIARGDQ